MKMMWKRVLSAVLAFILLFSSINYALAADTPYLLVFFNVNYKLNGKAFERRYNAELPKDSGEYDSGEYISWSSGAPYTLQSLAEDSGEFPVSPAGRVPDFQFAGWTVYTGDRDDFSAFTDSGAGEILDPNVGIVADQFEDQVDWTWRKANTGYSQLPLVGRWKLSGDAAPLALAPVNGGEDAVTGVYGDGGYYTLYGVETADRSAADLAAYEVDFDAGTNEYWLRVLAGTDTVSLSIIAPEPYVYDGATAGELAGLTGQTPGAYVSVNGGPAALMTKTVLNDSTGAAPSWTRRNSADYPARSQWTVTGLALNQTAAADPYNEVTVTIIPPNGDVSKKTVYTFHIQRLGEPSLITDPGNTPSGMIMREGKIADAKKTEALNGFESTRTLTVSLFGSSAVNNGGAVYGGAYSANAWTSATEDVDLDPAAIVAYQNSAFTVPGFQVTDSVGNTVSGGDYKDTMQYQLALRLESKLTWGSDTVGEKGTVNYYDGTGLTTTAVTPYVTTSDGKISFDLKGMNVVPGIYSLEYAFQDPISGETYTSDEDSFQVNKENASCFKRTLIVLPIPGDVDMDGTVTVADSLAMEAMLAGGSAFDTALQAGDPTASLIAYRVCDVDGDGDFNQSDITAVWNGYAPTVTANLSKSDYFYLPLPGSGGSGTRSAPIDKDASKPVLTLDYLGKTPETFDLGKLNNGTDLSQPADFGTGLELGDVFWVGVRLELPSGYTAADGGALKMELAAATMSIAYDSTLVKPVALDGLNWEETLEKYNIRSGTDGVYTNYMWSNDCSIIVGSETDKTPGLSGQYTAGASKAILPLEAAAGSSNIRELRVAVRLESGSKVYRSLGGAGSDYVLLRVPFQVVSHPNRATGLQALELSLGPKELSFAGLTSGGGTSLLAAAWDNIGGDPVFGGATGNLARQLTYGRGTALNLQLGEDKTEYQLLANQTNSGKTVYGEPFSVLAGTGGMTADDMAGLPEGLSYTSTGSKAGYIEGSPKEAGAFKFYVGNKPCKIVVEKAVLELTTTAQKIYYGENLSSLTFTYNVSQIKQIDKDKGFTGTGAESELSQLTGYVRPTLSPVTELTGGSGVSAGTPVGKYYITLTGGSSANYTLRYIKSGYNVEGAFDGGYGKLEILPRPVVIKELLKDEADPIAAIMYDGVQTRFTGMLGYYQSGDFLTRAGTAAYGMTLSSFGVCDGDELVLTYQADFIKRATDTETRFVLSGAVEYRDMAISNLVLKAGVEDNDNYVLVDPKLDTPTAVNAGKVFDRPAKKVEILKGIGTSYNTGAYLYLSGMTIQITYEAESNTATNTLSYSDRSSFANSGVQVTWENSADVAVPTVGHDVMESASHEYFVLSASAHNGKYIIVWVPTRAEDGTMAYVKAAVEAPLSVSKAKLTLTLDRVGRYYGENNPAVTFSYDPSQLPEATRIALTSALGHAPTGKSSELAEQLAGYQAPTIEVRDALYNPTSSAAPTKEVNASSPVPANSYFSIIHGGGSNDFDFNYATVSSVDPRTDYGYNYFDVEPRPIVVSRVVMSTENADSKYFLYDNTSLLQLYSVTSSAGKEKVTATSSGTEKSGELVDRFIAALPSNADRTYYPAGDYRSATLKTGYSLTGSAIVNSDELSLTYQANYKADAGRTEVPYFTLTQGSERRNVDIRYIALVDKSTNKSNGNYVLVYDNATNAVDRIPKIGTANGSVKLRAIKSIEIIQNPVSTYEYGNTLSLDQMILAITFETEGDNAAYNAVQQKKFVAYVENGVMTGNSFADLGLYVGWAPFESEATGDAAALAWAEAHPAEHGSFPTVIDHAGRQLMIYGRRYDGDPTVSAMTAIQGGIKVAKRTLPLKVTPQYRYYGEPNPQYEFTFQMKDLAEPDRTKVTGHSLVGSANQLGTSADSAALRALGGYYEGPQFDTAVDKSTEVGSGYPLTLSGGGMDNYIFGYTGSAIRIFRRPIIIEKVTKDPVYTISRNNTSSEFTTSAGFDEHGAMEFTTSLPGGGSYQNNTYDEDYKSAQSKGEFAGALSLTGNAVTDWDKAAQAIGLKLIAKFPPPADRVIINSGEAAASQPITILGLELTDGAKNYVLVYKNKEVDAANRQPANNQATGRVDRRQIKEIKVTSVPKTSVYTYGDVLNISNLQVQISYEADLGETGVIDFTEVVRADSRDGVYVNYYDKTTIPQNAADWQTVTDDYRLAANGDHLTRAPDHGVYLKSDGSKKNFQQANGMYLIVSARTDDDATQDFVRPAVVPASVQTSGENPVGTYRIQVNRLPLTFTLSAEGKTYDGNTQDVGSLTLTNAYNKNGVTDVVYTVTGANYEGTSPNYTDYSDFVSHLSTNGYTFSTGSYDSSTGFNYTGDGYGDGLTFAFVEPNVNYRTTPSLDHYGALAPRKVNVTGIQLGGADAENYSIVTEVLESMLPTATRPAAPEAVIDKASRAAPDILPGLEVDINTNAVRASMGADASVYNPTAFTDDYAGELRYEYRLEGWDKDEAGTVSAQKTPADGSYQDSPFFGGEPIEISLPAGYESTKEPTAPKEGDVVKGQTYRWAEEDDLFGLDENGLPLRSALQRDWVYRAQVRLAETHNYLASEPAASVGDGSLAAAAGDAADAARAAADALVKRAEGNMQRDKNNPTIYPDPAPMVKTYPQRLAVVSTADEQGKDGKRYTVSTLESVWFTDVLEYGRKEVLNSVLENFDPVRYYRFFWDLDQSSELEFKTDAPLDLSGELTVDIREKQADGSTVEKKGVTVNPAEPVLGGHSALLYVTTQADENNVVLIRTIEISPSSITAKVGDASIQLTATYKPSYATSKKLTWASSDESVASVSADGLVTFLAPGSATVTVRAVGGASASIVVIVGETAPFQGVFDRGFTKPFLTMTPEYAFLPDRVMNRGELAIMLARLYVDNPTWTGKGSGNFPDVTGKEGYAAAAKLLGEKGIITGITGGLFAANLTATRAEMAVIITRMMGLEVKNTKGQPHAFSDAGEKDTWAYAYIDALAEAGIVKGSGGGKFNPNSILTRAEAACMLARILDGNLDLTRSDLIRPTDVPATHWGYGEILRAVNGLPLLTGTGQK
ncbi:exported hypothetical protein [uncultured Eubacteriales bacterium]|uniref:SLH domain-containing protein n=1 Tax=uncultured Eubacteriales bacterium TaxID=172733 RepID=A0A212IWA0_9FIRM|nr:exported hypothetical protein [uncultured Eubacteriales bacterium]